MEQLLELIKQYAVIIDAYCFDYEFVYQSGEVLEPTYNLKYIQIYFRDTEKIMESMSFDTEEKAIEGMKGIIQFKQNAA